MNTCTRCILIGLFALAGATAAGKTPKPPPSPKAAEQGLQLSPPLGDGMVLQRGDKAPVFGTAGAGEKVVVTFRGGTAETLADDKGNWRADVVPGEPGGPFPMTIAGKGAVELKEVYVGDVWLCSGQSNMAKRGSFAVTEPNPNLRLYADARPTKKWQQIDPNVAKLFSGVGCAFGAELQPRIKVPVGLLCAAVGGTAIEQWLPPDKLKDVGVSGKGGELYVKHIRPLQPLAIKGVIWWQGEWNASDDKYDVKMTGLIESWRKDWGRGDFPFLFVQLQRSGKKGQAWGPNPVKTWAVTREAQRRVSVKDAAMVVSFDVTDGNLHPDSAKPIGERLALAARALAYGEKVEWSGPVLESAKLDGQEAVLTFSHAEGLAAKDGDLRDFEAGPQGGKLAPVKARVDGRTVRLDVTGLAPPLTVWYAYKLWPDGNLYNGAGLPASPFTVDVPK